MMLTLYFSDLKVVIVEALERLSLTLNEQTKEESIR